MGIQEEQATKDPKTEDSAKGAKGLSSVAAKKRQRPFRAKPAQEDDASPKEDDASKGLSSKDAPGDSSTKDTAVNKTKEAILFRIVFFQTDGGSEKAKALL